jgi:hypothetical protein
MEVLLFRMTYEMSDSTNINSRLYVIPSERNLVAWRRDNATRNPYDATVKYLVECEGLICLLQNHVFGDWG